MEDYVVKLRSSTIDIATFHPTISISANLAKVFNEQVLCILCCNIHINTNILIILLQSGYIFQKSLDKKSHFSFFSNGCFHSTQQLALIVFEQNAACDSTSCFRVACSLTIKSAASSTGRFEKISAAPSAGRFAIVIFVKLHSKLGCWSEILNWSWSKIMIRSWSEIMIWRRYWDEIFSFGYGIINCRYRLARPSILVILVIHEKFCQEHAD